MPGWYIHMEAAKKMVDALRAGQVGPEFPIPPAWINSGKTPQDWARQLGENAHTWRNYLALGAIGPDLFFLLPDFHAGTGAVLINVVDWVKDVYEPLDDKFLSYWQKYAGPVEDAGQDIANQLTGQVLNEFQQAFSDLSQALTLAVEDLLAQLWDWFGFFTSGVPQAFADNAFFWSDMFHYRKTYEFAQRLWTNADTPQKQAYALGWMSHCAVDVTGHSFVNSKCGGPYRTHWQRHHLIENHMDAYAYDAQHGGIEPYGAYDTSAIHFRIAFRNGKLAPYLDDQGQPKPDSPAYDYFSGFPAYPTGPSSTDRALRDLFFDLDTADLPADLVQMLIDSMHKVWDGGNARPGAGGPKVLFDVNPEYRDGDTGVPSLKVIQDTFWTLYHYLKFTASSGYKPAPPTRPPVIGDKRPPLPPGFQNVFDDPNRGGEDHQLSFTDILLALLAWPVYLAELGVWLATTLPSIGVDLATYPVRESFYELFVVPAYSAYLAARHPLVMAGFLIPKHDEINGGLVELGISPERAIADLKAALDSADGNGTAPPNPDEQSGRLPGQDFSADPSFPRDVVGDQFSVIANAVLHTIDKSVFCGRPTQPSEFLRPWAYPLTNEAGNSPVPGELTASHAGPWLQGQTARALLQPADGSAGARTHFEHASTPDETESQCSAHLPKGEHLGNPIDYSLYVVGQLTTSPDPDTPALPDFNLDSDRGYAYHCWDWNRKVASLAKRSLTTGNQDVAYRYDTYNQQFATSVQGEPEDRFSLLVPCTPPQGYCQGIDGQGNPLDPYMPNRTLAVHYLDGLGFDPGCPPSGPGHTPTAAEKGVAGPSPRTGEEKT
jgi:hypothetical protein